MNSLSYATAQLADSKQRLLDEIKDLNGEQFSYKPSPDKWSIAEVLEHIIITETGIGQLIQQALKTAPDSSRRSEIKVSDERIREILTNRAFKAQASESIQPMRRFATIDSAKNSFIESRDRNIAFIQNKTEDLRNRYWRHPATGTIDLYQSILLISAHCERHTMQIGEVKSSPGYPVNEGLAYPAPAESILPAPIA